MNRLAVVAGLALLVLLPHSALAWSGAGHVTITAMAYERLPQDVQRKVDAILLSHPRYGEWKGQWKADSGVSLGLYVFMQASAWADAIRQDSYCWVRVNGVVVEKDGKPVVDPVRKAEQDAYDHPAWHYTDWPLKPPDFPLEDRPSPDDDVVYAITQSRISVQGEHTSPRDRAASLSWLTHAIEDVHQPLHCATMFGPRFPYGDRGGNWFLVRTADQEPAGLHGLWDGAVRTSTDPARALAAARRLQADASLARAGLPELVRDKTPESWSLEGRELALSTVYLRGKLEPAPALFGLDPTTKRPGLLSIQGWNARPLPDDYPKNAVAAAQRCFALASYRLEDELLSLP